MKRFYPGYLFGLLFLAGCLQASEHLYVNDDGSGRLETHLVVPNGTLALTEKFFAGFVQPGFGDAPVESPAPEQQHFFAEGVFANQDDILEKARKAGAKVEILSFNSRRTTDGLYVDRLLTFDRLDKLLSSGILVLKVEIRKEGNGDWVAGLKEDPQRVEEARTYGQHFEDWQNSDAFQQLDPAGQEQYLSAMRDFKADLFLTFPFAIKDFGSAFAKVTASTALVSLRGNLLEDPELIQRFFSHAGKSEQVVWGGAPSPEVPPARVPEKNSALRPREAPLSSPSTPPQSHSGGGLSDDRTTRPQVKVTLKDGHVVEGPLLQRTKDDVTVELFGVPVVYYSDEINRIE